MMMIIIIIILLRCGATSGLEGTCLAQELVENEQLGKAGGHCFVQKSEPMSTRPAHHFYLNFSRDSPASPI